MFTKTANFSLALVAFSLLFASPSLQASVPGIIQSYNLGCPSSNAGEHCVKLALNAYTLGVINKGTMQSRRCSELDGDEGKVQCVFLDGDETQFYCDNQKNTSLTTTFGAESEFSHAQAGFIRAYWKSHENAGSPQKYSQRYSNVKDDVLHVLC